MKRREKGEEVPAIKVQSLAEKLQRGAVVVGKKGGQSTPVLPPWRIFMDSVPISQRRRAPPIPARKLAANLWELHQYRHPFSEMHSGVSGNRFRRNYADGHETHHVPDRSRDLRSAGGLRRHVVASLMQNRHSNEGNHRALPLSPGSYDSSVEVEVAPYNPAESPSSSLDYKARVGEKCYSLNTSRELLKVLNHIWKLEEQNTSNLSLVKGLKKELHHAHTIIKELVMDNKADKHEIKELRHHIADDITNDSAIKSARNELEDERKLRKRSEVLHRKLAGELYEVKTSLSKALKDLERERKSRELLENLCDEFALEIRKLCTECNPLILQISEKWLDERLGTRVGEEGQNGKKTSVADKFGSEIESFLQGKRTSHSKRIVNIRRSSLESVPLNGASSAPQEVGDEDDSGSDSHCFELNRPSIGGLADLREGEAQETETLIEPNPTTVEVKFEDQKTQPSSSKQVEVNLPIKPGISEVGAEGGDDRGKSHMHPGHDYEADSSVWRRNASPVRQWATSFQPQDIELSSKLPSNLKDNTLKAKLVESRARAQRSRPRLKASKGFR